MDITVHLHAPLCECEPKNGLYTWNIGDAGIWVQCTECKTTLQIPKKTLWARWDLSPKKPSAPTTLPSNVVKLFPKK